MWNEHKELAEVKANEPAMFNNITFIEFFVNQRDRELDTLSNIDFDEHFYASKTKATN